MPWGFAAVAAATAMSVMSSIQQSHAAASAANYNAKVAEQNAKIATQNAEWSGAEGEQRAGISGLKSKETTGAIRTAQAANNIDVNTGSAAQVQRSQQVAGMTDVSNIRSNAARQAYGYETQTFGNTAQANLYRSQASNATTAGYMGAATSLFKGLGSMYMGGAFGGGGDTPLGASSFSQGSSTATDKAGFLSQIPQDNFSLWQNSYSTFPGTQ